MNSTAQLEALIKTLRAQLREANRLWRTAEIQRRAIHACWRAEQAERLHAEEKIVLLTERISGVEENPPAKR